MMTRTNPDTPGLGALLADTLECDSPDLELLVRYADDPASLAPEERSHVEWHLAQSPVYAAQLRLLRRTDFEALSGARDLASLPAHRTSPARPSRVTARRARAALIATAAATAAAALLALVQSDGPTPAATSTVPLDLAQLEDVARETPSSVDSRITDAGIAGSDTLDHPPRAPGSGDVGAGDTDVRSAETPSRAVATAQVDAASPTERAPQEAESRPRVSEARAPREPAAAPVPPVVAGSDPRAVAVTTPGAGDAMRRRLLAEPPTEAQLLALALPQYRAPAEAEPRPRRGSALRGAGAGLELRAMAPPHVARTAQAAPALFWRIDALPPEGAEIELAITTPTAIDPLVRRSLVTPVATGLQRIALDPQTETLPVGVVCQWSIVVRSGSGARKREELVSGWILRVDDASALESAIEGDAVTAVPAALAAAGLWYDALETTVELAARFPDHPRVAQALADLIAQSGS